jgi:nitrogen fixation protein
MARDIPADLKTELTQKVIAPAYLVEIELQDSTLYLCDTAQNIVWGGHTYLANGWIQAIADISESTDPKSMSIDITLGGIPEEINSLMFLNIRQNKKAAIYFATVNVVGALNTTPYLIFRGLLDYPEINDSAEESTITLHYDSAFAKLDKPSNRRYTDEEQKVMFPGDRGFEFIKKLVEDWNGTWGKPKPPAAQKDNKSQRKNPPRRTR